MKSFGKIAKTAYLIITFLAVLLSLGTATYAWFSTNSVTDTTKASGKTNVENVKLLLSASGGSAFQGSDKEVAIARVNAAGEDGLLPVSTADLHNYVSNIGSVDGKAVTFEKVKDEAYIYHGRLYLQAVSENPGPNAKLALFFDESAENGGKLLQNINGFIANASRLGIIIDNNTSYIFKFGDDKNPGEDHFLNTIVDGKLLEEGFVLVMDENGEVKGVKDPAVQYSDYLVSADGTITSTKPLLYMYFNQIYTIDIYFYLEGCDPDCTDITEYDDLDFHLGFYGILTEEVP